MLLYLALLRSLMFIIEAKRQHKGKEHTRSTEDQERVLPAQCIGNKTCEKSTCDDAHIVRSLMD